MSMLEALLCAGRVHICFMRMIWLTMNVNWYINPSGSKEWSLHWGGG